MRKSSCGRRWVCMDRADQTEQLVRMLHDAGCGSRLITQFSGVQKDSDDRKLLRMLKHQRFSLLEKLHEIQKKLDCLDYLIFHMKQEDSSNSRRQQ